MEFEVEIGIIGVNPFVFLPERVLSEIFGQAGKSKGAIPVRVKIEDENFEQTLVRYSGEWRLYINNPMLKSSGKKVGDKIRIEIEFDSSDRKVPVHPELEKALKDNQAVSELFYSQAPSRQKEINRYLYSLKTDESINRNVEKIIRHLSGETHFAGRKSPLANNT